MDGTELMKKVAEVAPEKYDFIVKTASEVRSSPFRDEIVTELDGIIKKAAMSSGEMGGMLGRGVLSFGAGVAAHAMGGVALALAGDAVDSLRRGITKTRNYKRMLAANPDLRDKPAAEVQAIFSTLHRFNPDFSGDPLVAGSFVRNHADLGAGIGLESLKSLVDSRKGLNESRRFQSFKMPELPNPERERLEMNKLRREGGGGGEYGGKRLEQPNIPG